LIPVEEALRRILERTPRLPAETVGLEAARGRVLREDVFADRDLPPFHRSAVDGYAVRAACLAGGGRLRVVEQIPAGTMPKVRLGPGEAAAIMTAVLSTMRVCIRAWPRTKCRSKPKSWSIRRQMRPPTPAGSCRICRSCGQPRHNSP